MSTITITGKFTTKSENQHAEVEVYNIMPAAPIKDYDFKKTEEDDFSITLNDLSSGGDYYIYISGYTFGGDFTYAISGDFKGTNPITDTYNNSSFKPIFQITTNP